MKKVVILLSTYNGEKFLNQQLDSIINQSYSNWQCYVRDDCSIDNTKEIIKKYATNYPGKFKIIVSQDNKGPAQSFMTMLETINHGDYYMFCDQDDIWLNDKIEKTLNKMKESENKNVDKPILVHTDLKLIDSVNREIGQSAKKIMNLNPRTNKLENLLVDNNVTGCTIMINANARNKIKKSEHILMHDWWIAIYCSCFGVIEYIDEPLMLYRQHEGNVIGAGVNKYSRNKKMVNIFKKINKIKELPNRAEKLLMQTKAFYDIYYHDFDIINQEKIEYFLTKPLRALIKNNLSMQTNSKKIKYLIYFFVFNCKKITS